METHRLLLLLAALTISVANTRCQVDTRAIDSTTLADADWHMQSKDGVAIGYHNFDYLFGEPQALYIVVIPPSETYRLHLAADSVLTTVAEQAQRLDATLAINGTYFNMDSTITYPICHLRIDSTEIGYNEIPRSGDTSLRKYFQYATLVLAADTIDIIIPEASRHYERSLPHPNIMNAGPMLIWDGQIVKQRTDRTFVTHRHNRTAIGLRPDGSVVMLVADGRFSKFAAGLTIPQLQLAMLWLGCHKAMNLDGGGSSTLYVDGNDFDNTDGIVNYPSDNHKLDHMGQRAVANIIYLAHPQKNNNRQQ